MRRTVARRISAYEFGHPHMATGFGGVFVNKPDASHIVDAGVQKTVLDNGATVVTHDKGGLATTVGMYAAAGAKFDPSSAPGLSFVMRHGLLGGNIINSNFQNDRAFRTLGASFGHTEVNKSHIGAFATTQRPHFRVVLDTLAPGFSAPRFAESDLERFRDNMDAQREELRWNVPREYAVDELEQVAFYKEALGSPRMVRPETNDLCSSTAAIDKYCTYMTPSRVTVVGVNVNHQELVAAYDQQSMQHSSSAPHHERAAPILEAGDEKKQYQAGKSKFEFENRSAAMGTKPDQEAEGIVALGWLSNGVADMELYAATLIYKEMIAMTLGEGTANKARSNLVHGAQSFYRPFDTAGLIGITVRGAPQTLLGRVQEAIATTPTDFAGMLPAAKARAAAAFYQANMERDVDYASFLGSSPASADEVLEAIAAATPTAVAQTADLSRSSKATMFATGDVMHLPTLKHL